MLKNLVIFIHLWVESKVKELLPTSTHFWNNTRGVAMTLHSVFKTGHAEPSLFCVVVVLLLGPSDTFLGQSGHVILHYFCHLFWQASPLPSLAHVATGMAYVSLVLKTARSLHQQSAPCNKIYLYSWPAFGTAPSAGDRLDQSRSWLWVSQPLCSVLCARCWEAVIPGRGPYCSCHGFKGSPLFPTFFERELLKPGNTHS